MNNPLGKILMKSRSFPGEFCDVRNIVYKNTIFLLNSVQKYATI